MQNKRPAQYKLQVTRPQKVFKPFPQNTTPMVLYRTPSQFSLTNPLQKRLTPEKKNVDVTGSVGNATFNQWSEVDLLNGVNTGTGPSERIGRKIQLKSLLLRWVSSTGSFSGPIRILIIYDRQPDGAIPIPQSILQVDGASPTFNSPMNLGNSDRYVILSDEVSEVQATNPSSPVVRSGKIYRKINLPMQYLDPGSTITSVSSGAIYILSCVQNGPTGAGIGYYSRIRYIDV